MLRQPRVGEEVAILHGERGAPRDRVERDEHVLHLATRGSVADPAHQPGERAARGPGYVVRQAVQVQSESRPGSGPPAASPATSWNTAERCGRVGVRSTHAKYTARRSAKVAAKGVSLRRSGAACAGMAACRGAAST